MPVVGAGVGVGVGVGVGAGAGAGVGVGATITAPPSPPGAVAVPEPAPHAEMERTEARAMELWLKIRTPNFPSKHSLKGECQDLDKTCLSKMVNDFPSSRLVERAWSAATGTIPPVHALRPMAQIATTWP